MREIKIFALIAFVAKFAETALVTNEDYALLPPIFKLDDYDLCLSVQNSTYCYAKIQVLPKNPTKPTKIWRIIEEVNRSPENYRHDWLRHGICVPNWSWSTTKNLHGELSKEVQKRLQSYDLRGNLLEVHCENQKSPYEIKSFDRIFGALLIVYVIFLVASSFLVHFHGSLEGSFVWEILGAFSIPKNFARLSTIKSPSDATRFLKFMYGMRFYQTLVVTLVHSGFILQIGPVLNTNHFNLMPQLLKILCRNGSVLLETFFVMAGWLLSYNFCLIFERYQKVNFGILVYAMMKRLIRLTPVLAVTVAFHSTFLVHLGRGPVWDLVVGTEYRNCRKNWWTNLLYINSYWDSTNMCMQHTWYLAADTQAYLFSVIILALVWRFQKYTKIILGASLAITVLIPGVFNYLSDQSSIYFIYPEYLYKSVLNNKEWLNNTRGHTHLGSYTIGMIFGMLFYRYNKVKYFGTNTTFAILRWFLTVSLGLFIVYSGQFWYEDGFAPSKFYSAFILTINNNCYSVCAGLVMFGLSQGEGWFIRRMLNWKPVIILERITYSVYIIHFGMIKVKTALTRQPVYLNTYVTIIWAFGDFTSTYIVAFFMCLLFEMPTTGILHLLLKKHLKKD